LTTADDPPGAFSTDVQVVGRRPLTVEEIVARHQASRLRQAAVLQTLIAAGRSVLTFEVPGASAPYSVTADTVLYAQGGAIELEQKDIRLNGTAVRTPRDGVPRLPIVNPDRLSVPPLVISLTDHYRYRLEGHADVDGHPCHIVSFAPAVSDRSFLSGRVWIAADDFGVVRLEAAQTGMSGAIVSSHQRETFAPLALGEQIVWVPARSETHQIYEGPGHRTPIHRLTTFDRHELNPTDFAARRLDAHRSSSVILTDAFQGLQYLGRGEDADGLRRAPRSASRLRTVVFGAVFDPNISRPLPYAGFSYLDFDFLGSGTEVHAFFGGLFGQLAWTTRALGPGRWRVFGSAFGIVADYHDRSFRDGVEHYDENLLQRPARLTVGVLQPLTARTRLRAAYEFDYTRLRRARSTGAAFQVPADSLVDGLRLSLEAERGPWTTTAWWNPARRREWHAWGWSAESDAARRRAFQRFGVSLARSVVFSPRLVGHVETAWMDGTDLDRFSMYSVDGFANRLRGYPTASVRYDRGAVGRTALAWQTPFGGRLDGFFDAALVGDTGDGRNLRGLTGVGAGIEVPAPGGTLLSVEWGYGMQARGRDGGLGTHVLKVSGQKIF
jgi:hypothetical protein